MRVAVVAEWYPSPGDPVLGIWAHRQAVAARDAGAEVRVLALRRPIPPLSVARQLFHIPPATGLLSRWIEGARTSLRPVTLDGLEIIPVPFLAPPRPISYGSWGYWMAPPLARALHDLHRDWPFDVLHAHNLAPAGHAAARWVRRRGPAFVVSAHGPDMIHVAENSSVGRRACVAAMAKADVVIANSTWAARRCEAIAGRPLPVRVVYLGADIPPATPAHNGTTLLAESRVRLPPEGGPEDIAAAGQGMVLVAPDDPGALAAEIKRLISDPAELRRLGAAARETVAAHFTWERCGVETLAAYRAALEAR